MTGIITYIIVYFEIVTSIWKTIVRYRISRYWVCTCFIKINLSVFLKEVISIMYTRSELDSRIAYCTIIVSVVSSWIIRFYIKVAIKINTSVCITVSRFIGFINLFNVNLPISFDRILYTYRIQHS